MIGAAIQKVAQRQPSAIAIEGLDKSVSYSELIDHIQRAAAHLKKIAPQETYIGLIADQSVNGVIAMLAIMWCGKVVVPIDPRFDTTLIAEMLSPFTKTVLVDSHFKQFMPPDFHVCDTSDLVQKSNATIHTEQPQQLAYILHTSGTTGKPKAVVASRKALNKVSRRLARRYYIAKSTRVLQFARLSFDSAMVETCSTLLVGGVLVIPGRQLREDLYGTLAGLLSTKRIQVATLPPSVIIPMEPSLLSNLKSLIVAGEPCPPQLANRLYKSVPHFINAYGPTESIVCATTYEVTRLSGQSVPIGTALPGVKVTLRDPETGQECLSGSGEICISGDMLADGYANKPGLTNQKFINATAGRYYRSGDIGSFLPDGSLKYLGRVDNQIKLNGQRIELEGVEATIQEVLALDKAVVFVPEQMTSLVCAYIAPYKIDTAIFTEKLTGKLPSFAIPATYRHLDSLPLDRNGKVDRKTLSRTYTPEPVASGLGVASEVQQMIEVWRNILGDTGQINENSDFFEIGGDSLGAMRLIADISRVFNKTLSLSEILDDPITPQHMTEIVIAK